jgi:hypothetical protein
MPRVDGFGFIDAKGRRTTEVRDHQQGIGRTRDTDPVASEPLEVDAVDRADPKRMNGGLVVLGGAVGHHDQRHRPKPHQSFEKLEPVHPRHLDVKRQHFGVKRLDRLARL